LVSNQLFDPGLGIAGVFVFGWRDVAEIAVDALRVEPMHPSQRGELNVGDGAPWSLVGSVDQLGFVEAVRRFRQGVIERLSG
jgi:hypothetical protein